MFVATVLTVSELQLADWEEEKKIQRLSKIIR